MEARGHSVSVVVFYGSGAFESEFCGTTVRLIPLNKRSRWDVLPFLYRLVVAVRTARPKVLHSYLSVANILAVMLKPLLPGARIVWGVRSSNVDVAYYGRILRIAYGLERHLSRFVDLIIANSYAGRDYAIAHGFFARRMTVVANGIDTQYFRFDPDGRARMRSEWGVREDELLIGIAARIDPMKDHATFLRAASLLAIRYPKMRFVCVGGGPPEYLERLINLAESLGLTDRLIRAGSQDNMPYVYSAFDVACSASAFGEGFSNSIGEAMACGVPCVVTDVGDSALIVGDTGVVVPPSNPDALAQGIIRIINIGADRRLKCRERIVTEFGIDKLISQTTKVLGFS
jgi:glycosyltransferase involved in cell wall biosynthesis